MRDEGWGMEGRGTRAERLETGEKRFLCGVDPVLHPSGNSVGS